MPNDLVDSLVRGIIVLMRSRRGAPAFAIAACAFVAVTSAGAQDVPPAHVDVDAAVPGMPLNKVWAYHGFDEVNYSTSSEGRELLGALGAISGVPPYIRSHFLLNSGDGTPALKWGSTNVYSEDGSGNPVYDWNVMDGILDTLTAARTLPLVEIGFMPHDLAAAPADPYRNSSPFTLDGHCFNPPKDYSKWGSLIRQWAAHVRDRYPDVESSWQWELWNEPDLPYWTGTAAEYFALFDYTEAALHEVLPLASLGGPAVAGAGSAFLRQFLQHCAAGTNAVTGTTGTRLDTITFHAKGGVSVVDGHVQMNLGNQLRLHRAGFNALGAAPQFENTPVIVTEADPDGCAACTIADYPQNAYRLSPAYGSYVVEMTKRTLDLAERLGVNLRGLLTWAFLFPDTPYFVGYRALVTNGVHLPVLNAFKLLGRLEGNRLPVVSSASLSLDEVLDSGVRGMPDIDAMATRHGDQVTVLVWNYHDDLVAVASAQVHLTVALPATFASRVAVSHRLVDDTHGNAYPVWVSQGSPAAPSTVQISALQQAMQPSPGALEGVVDVVSGSVSLDFELPRFGLSLITITPATAETGGAADASPPGDRTVYVAGGGCACRAAASGELGAVRSLALGLFGALALGRRRRERRTRA